MDIVQALCWQVYGIFGLPILFGKFLARLENRNFQKLANFHSVVENGP